MSAPLAALSAREVLRRFEIGDLTSVALIDVLLERIAALDAPDSPLALNAVAGLSNDARHVARERDDERAKGQSRGPLHGVPVLIKDNIEAVGLPGLAGSTSLLGRPTRDATLVTRLREAGAIVLGSTNLSEWANIRSPRSSSGWSASGGLVANPWALDRSAGGSSSGSGAAVAAGLAPLAVGTETDGSIVCPSSVNGVVGLKPTVGNVPTTHVVPISSSQDSPGPMGRSVEDVALLYAVLADQDPSPPATLSVAVAANMVTGHPATDRLFDEVVADFVAGGIALERRDVALPVDQVDYDEATVMFSELYDDLTAYLAARPGEGVRSLADVIAFEDAHSERELPYFGHENFLAAQATGGRAGEAYAEAHARNLAWAVDTCLGPALDGVDVLIAPAWGPSWKSDLIVGGHPGPSSAVTRAPAIAGWPILCLPFGLVGGLPVGLAIVGRPQSEWTILEAGRQLEALLRAKRPWPRPAWTAPSKG